jgi:hypothetical protein
MCPLRFPTIDKQQPWLFNTQFLIKLNGIKDLFFGPELEREFSRHRMKVSLTHLLALREKSEIKFFLKFSLSYSLIKVLSNFL